MPKSMTGFGAAEGELGGGRMALEIRTVNHRHFSTQFRLPADLQRFEAEIRNRLRERMERGHAVLSARWTDLPATTGPIRVDVERARAVVRALAELQMAVDLSGTIDLAFVARQPGVLSDAGETPREIEAAELLALIDRAMEAVQEMRGREGGALARDLTERLRELESLLDVVAARAPHRLVAERDRLRRAVADLADGRGLDEARLAQEIALLADRLDITEETVRLRAHMAAFADALQRDVPVGKQLSFIGQELLREVNTIGSKANDADIAQAVIAMKGVLEKIREQVENLE